jgi:hypothetical protein
MDPSALTVVATAAASTASAQAIVVATYSVSVWLQVILLGAVTGAMGQVIRQIASLKKILDNHPGDRLSVLLDQTRIVVNLLIGATAGVVGALSLGIEASGLETKTILSLVGFGYAGADFIESFMRKAEPPKNADAPQPTAIVWPIPQAKG